MVVIAEEHVHPAVSPLGDVMWNSGRCHSRDLSPESHDNLLSHPVAPVKSNRLCVRGLPASVAFPEFPCGCARYFNGLRSPK